MRELAGMTPPITGRCLCGAVRYVCSAPPFWSVNCHCRACQRLSGAPFVSAFCVSVEAFAFEGETRPFRRPSDAGHEVTTWLCAACGARMFAESAGATGHMNIFASTLAEPSAFKALSNVYLAEAASWIAPPPARFNFPRMPGPPDEAG
ncbi:GFA family protein [uncultured Caulobacter sp.]|uniref:GFA family protein n=1 Tax=uncultured Caulobacter sp. TaxID=158749 RepID=UPI0026271AC2|nr:GFA family protein [uncultured Caulobacter sp.]